MFGIKKEINKNELNPNKNVLFEYKATFAVTKRYSKSDKPETPINPYKFS